MDACKRDGETATQALHSKCSKHNQTYNTLSLSRLGLLLSASSSTLATGCATTGALIDSCPLFRRRELLGL